MDKTGWKKNKLGNICTVVSGGTPKTENPSFWGKGHYWVTPAEIKATDCFIYKTERQITDEALKSTKLQLLPEGTVLLSSRAPIGKVAICGVPMYCNQGFKNCICSDAINNRFLFHFLKAKNELLNSLGRGATFKEISKSIVEDVDIDLPPLATQASIVAELDKINHIISQKKEQIKDLDKLAQSLFYEMFGDPVENKKGWEIVNFIDVGEFARGVSKHRPRNAPELLGGSMPLIQTGDVTRSGMYITEYNNTYSDIGVAQSKVWSKGTICVTIAANIGECSILTFDACFPDSVVGFTSNGKVDNIYVYFVICSLQKILEHNAPGVAQKNINLKILNTLSLPLPPLSLQRSFAAKIEAIEAHKTAVQASIADLQTLLDARMQEYFG